MSTNSCDRAGCPSVMCLRRSPKYGFICRECFEELVERGITQDIESFMRTPKPVSCYGKPSDARTFFDEEFPMETF